MVNNGFSLPFLARNTSTYSFVNKIHLTYRFCRLVQQLKVVCVAFILFPPQKRTSLLLIAYTVRFWKIHSYLNYEKIDFPMLYLRFDVWLKTYTLQ